MRGRRCSGRSLEELSGRSTPAPPEMVTSGFQKPQVVQDKMLNLRFQKRPLTNQSVTSRWVASWLTTDYLRRERIFVLFSCMDGLRVRNSLLEMLKNIQKLSHPVASVANVIFITFRTPWSQAAVLQWECANATCQFLGELNMQESSYMSLFIKHCVISGRATLKKQKVPKFV